MKRLSILLAMTLVWSAMTGSLSPLNLLLGAAVSALSLWLVRGQIDATATKARPLRLLLLCGLFFKELALSAIKVAILVVQPKMRLKPGIVAYPLSVTRDFEITLLANLITLTPGTLSVDVSADRRLLYVHALDCSNPAAVKRDIANGFERRIREAFPL